MSLENMVGQTFVSERNGIRTEAVLESVRRRKVVLREEGRKDSFTMEVAQFHKKFRHRDTQAA